MIMITGGAYQGKTQYAENRFGLTDDDITDGNTCDISDVANARCIRHYELLVKRLIMQGTDPLEFTKNLDMPIVIMNESGSGIIPLDKSEREWREISGRAGCIIADKAIEVVRVCCGIATVIKGETL